MKTRFAVLLALVMALFVSANASAESAAYGRDAYLSASEEVRADTNADGEERARKLLRDKLLEDAGELPEHETPFFSFSDTARELSDGTWEWSMAAVLNRLSELFFGELKRNVSSLVKIVIIAILSGVLCNLQGPFNREGIAEISFIACFTVIAGMAVQLLAGLVVSASEAVDRLTLFMQALIPAVTGLAAAGGGAAGSLSLSPALMMCMQTVTYLAKNVFLPMILILSALSVVNSLSGRFSVARLIELGRTALKWSSGILLTVFIGLLGLQGFTAAFADGVAGKTVKYAVSSFVPLVGGILSDSVEAVCASALIVKNAVGMTGVLAIVSICLGPLLHMLAVSLLYRLAAGLAEPATDRRIVGLLGELAGNITQIFVVLLTVSVMFIIGVALLCAATSVPMLLR